MTIADSRETLTDAARRLQTIAGNLEAVVKQLKEGADTHHLNSDDILFHGTIAGAPRPPALAHTKAFAVSYDDALRQADGAAEALADAAKYLRRLTDLATR